MCVVSAGARRRRAGAMRGRGVAAVFAGAHGGGKVQRLGYDERVADGDSVGAQVIPRAQALNGDAEAVCDGDEGIAVAHGVMRGVHAAGGGGRGDGDDKLVALVR